VVEYFFDTCAIIECLLRNPAYARFGDAPLATTVMNKIEMYWWALNRYDQALADILLRSLAHAAEVTDDVIRDAMLFRKQHKKRGISYTDAIGYVFARKQNLVFLTGDSQFKDLPGVEFVPMK
jgi:predicted nucleic acid-binding protein